MALTAAQNPMNPSEALVFFYSLREIEDKNGTKMLTNLGIQRRSLHQGRDYEYRDFNIHNSPLREQPSGLAIGYYNGAPRVFGFSRADPSKQPEPNEDFIVTQVSPTWTPINKVDGEYVKGKWLPPIAVISDVAGDAAHVFYLAPTGTTGQASLVTYILDKNLPQFQTYDIKAVSTSMLAAVKNRKSGSRWVFFQSSESPELIKYYDLETDTQTEISNIKCWANSPLAATHINLRDEGDMKEPLYLYYVHPNQRIVRVKYEYGQDVWRTSSISQVNNRRVPAQHLWISVVPVDATRIDVFYFENSGELVQLSDDLTQTKPPTENFDDEE
ncbi:hypothetical protein BDV28DRAFT_41596 [Aspergillus coremiiformis]|uniref:Fucose-specific lectin n=1 Tax=Aspergillus coremiiformis TaxID=138285 RepID=A0A5N6ZH73_9EURO|nr:hypothetical protein BDV28DRAFT_41596 [Aspergillus coremiiformis]